MFSVPSYLAPQVWDSSKIKPSLVNCIPETDEEIDADIQETEASVFSSFSRLWIDVKTRLENQAPQTDEEYDEETNLIIAGMQNSVMCWINHNF